MSAPASAARAAARLADADARSAVDVAAGARVSRPAPVAGLTVAGLTVGGAGDAVEHAPDAVAVPALARLRTAHVRAAESAAENAAEPHRPAAAWAHTGGAGEESGSSRRLRRWFQPMKETVAVKGIPSRALPQPVHTSPPLGKKQTVGVMWEEIVKEPRTAYRFVDSDGAGWEAKGPKDAFVRTDWHQAKEKEAAASKAWWFDGQAGTWHQGKPPATLRPALAEERGDLTREELHGYAGPDAIPVYVKAKYRPKASSKKTKGHRGAGLRALDRAARLLMQDMPEVGTPHLATATVGGSLLVAGNTGGRYVSAESSTRATTNLATALDTSEPLPSGRRAAKDARKLRALQSGDYRAHHSRDRDLEGVSEALDNPPVWRNVDASAGSAEHGEMTVLAEVYDELSASPNRTGQVIVRPLGGVKLACGACKLAFEAFNRFIAAPLGYSVKVSGTHGGFFNGWRAPDVIWDNENAIAYVEAGLPKGAYLTENGVLLGVGGSEPSYHDPEESESEWEEVTD